MAKINQPNVGFTNLEFTSRVSRSSTVNLDVDSVCVDDCGAAEMAISHLMEMGHTKAAVITGSLTLQSEQERLRGYCQALQNVGISIDRSLIWSSNFEQQELRGYARMVCCDLLKVARECLLISKTFSLIRQSMPTNPITDVVQITLTIYCDGLRYF